jgi:hypothetical protein
MTHKTAILLICAALAAGCHRTQTAKRSNPNYQVVEEGQAGGVTSTISGPGETPPPLTDTAIDTTTNFTLPDNPAPLGTQPPGTIAGTLPTYTPYPSAAPTPRPRPAAPPPMSSGTAQPAPQQTAPPTDTAVTDEVLPPTETTATQPPPAKDEQKKEGEQTDTSSTTTTATPPPPTPPV